MTITGLNSVNLSANLSKGFALSALIAGTMANKYKKQAKQAQKQRKLERACLHKRAFQTEDDASRNWSDAQDQYVYQCPNCDKWHRTTGMSKLIAKVSRRL